MNTAPTTIAQRVRGYRAAIAADPKLDYLDATYWLVSDTPERTWTPSELGRALGIDTTEARGYLDDLASDRMIASTERGAWTRYTKATR